MGEAKKSTKANTAKDAKKKEEWDFEVPKNTQERIKKKVGTSDPAQKERKILDPSMANGKTLVNARKKLNSTSQSLTIESTEAIRKKRTSRAGLAKQYDYDDRIEKLKKSSPIDRLFAGSIDIAYLGVIVFSAQFFVPMVKKEYLEFLIDKGVDQMLAPEVLDNNIQLGIIAVIFILLYALPTFLFGKSVGKIFRGQRIGNVTDGVSISRPLAVIRELILRPISLISIVGILMMFFGDKRQGLHDKILNTSIFPNES